MNETTLVAVALVVFVVYIALAPSSLPDLPGPSMRDYLPGGLANKMYADPGTASETIMALARRHGPVFQMWLGATRTVVVTDPADIVHVTSNSDDFERPPSTAAAFDAAMPSSIFTMPRAEHLTARRKLRHNFNHALLPDFHAPMLGAATEITAELRAAAAAQAAATNDPRPVDINSVLSTATTRIILNVALGGAMDLAERKEFARDMDLLVREMLQELMQYPVRQAFVFAGTRAKLDRYRRKVQVVAHGLVERRIAEKPAERDARSPDLLDAILTLDAHDAERRVSQVGAFVVAGAHTVSVSLAYTLFHLCCNPRVQNKLEAEIDAVVAERKDDAGTGLTREEVQGMGYLRKVWKETLRFSPPGTAIIRQTRRAVTLKGSGTRLPAGTQVDALFYAAHMSERCYDEADKFIPERWGATDAPGDADRVPAGAFLPFGAGQRSCAGQFLAEYEGPLLLAELVRCFSFELACPKEEIRSVSGIVEVPRWSSKRDGKMDMGVPLFVRERS